MGMNYNNEIPYKSKHSGTYINVVCTIPQWNLLTMVTVSALADGHLVRAVVVVVASFARNI